MTSRTSKSKYRGRWLGIHSRHWPAVYRMSGHLPDWFEGDMKHAIPEAHQHLSEEELRKVVKSLMREYPPSLKRRGSFVTRREPFPSDARGFDIMFETMEVRVNALKGKNAPWRPIGADLPEVSARYTKTPNQ